MAANLEDDELTAAIQAIRDRVRARHPENGLGVEGVAAADLLPLLHARDAAEAKVAAIGTVNPRPPGLKNNIAQWFKRKISRALDWHVREQVEFNRAAVRCVQASLEALTETNRALAMLATHHRGLREEMERTYREEILTLRREAQELKDIRTHWAEWRVGFEDRRAASEIHLLRTISELQGAFQHRVTLLEQNLRQTEQSYRETAQHQHREFTDSLHRNTVDVQKRLWADLQEVQRQFEKLIHTELKVIRLKSAPAPSAPAPALSAETNVNVDWLRFAETFRGSEEDIRDRQRHYVLRFAGSAPVLDLGCGRGEFLEAARDAGLHASGIDQSEECIALCRSKGLHAEKAELFAHLDSLVDQSLGGIYCAQVVEHIDPHRLPDLIMLMARKLRSGALAVIETPNPECLAIFATHSYIDPTHTRPVPPRLLAFYMEEAGFGRLEIERLSPAVNSMPALAELPAAVREQFFGGLDYVIFGRKL
jgi:O-antigen chain-terminating methyltransferase